MPRCGDGISEMVAALAMMPPDPPDPAQLVPMLQQFDMELVPAESP